MTEETEIERRALAALRALAVGDAMGAATEGYLPDEVEEVYDAPIAELVEPVNLYPDTAPDRRRGAVGVLTEGAVAAARWLADGGSTPDELPGLGWAVTLGIVFPAGSAALLVYARRFAEDAAGGGAIAAAVAAGVGSYLPRDALNQALGAAGRLGDWPLAERIIRAAGIGQESGGRHIGALVAAEFPPGPRDADAIAFAFGVAFGAQSVRRGLPQAVNQGGRASLTAGLVGALCGSVAPSTLVEAWADEVEAASDLDLAGVVQRLLALRRAGLHSAGMT